MSVGPRGHGHRRLRDTRLARMLAGLFVALVATVGISDLAAAQDDDIAIKVQVKDQQRDASGKADNQPVPGVTVVVVDAAGNEVGSAETDADGVALIPVPGKADYVVRIDVETLPEGLALAEGTPAEVPVGGDKFISKTKIVNFFTGKSQSAETSSVDRVSQRIADGVRLGLIIAMCSVGLSLIFGTTGLTNFAHGEMVTFGAMVAFFFNSFIGVHILIGAPIAVVAGGLFGWFLNAALFAQLRKRGVGLISQMVITVGLSIVLRNVYLSQFEGRDRPYLDYGNQTGRRIGPVVITPRDLIITILAAVILVSVALTLQYTRLGKATRAVSDNVDLASATGIDTAKVIRTIWIAGGGLAAIGGVFRGLDEFVAWDMGTSLLFLMFAGITLGGLGNAYGALVGGFVVGVMVETATLIPRYPTELKTVPALLILIVILLVRPQGILGRAQRVG